MICLGRFFRPEKSPEHVFVSTPVRNEKHGRCIGGDVMSAIEKPKRKGLPSDEIVWETYRKDGNDKYVVTSKKIRDFYFIYEVSPTGYNKLGKAKTPPELYEKYIKEVWERA